MPERRRALVFACGLLFGARGATAVDVALVDPTRPPETRAPVAAQDADEGSIASKRVQMILVSPTRRMAVIGGVRVVPGDEVLGAVVTSISPDHVVLRGAEGEIRLPLRRIASKAPIRAQNGGGR